MEATWSQWVSCSHFFFFFERERSPVALLSHPPVSESAPHTTAHFFFFVFLAATEISHFALVYYVCKYLADKLHV